MVSKQKLSRDYSIGIGLHGAETHTYAVPVFSKEAFYTSYKMSERFVEGNASYGLSFWRTIKVRVLSQMEICKEHRVDCIITGKGRFYVRRPL
jgi:hypothetical protein